MEDHARVRGAPSDSDVVVRRISAAQWLRRHVEDEPPRDDSSVRHWRCSVEFDFALPWLCLRQQLAGGSEIYPGLCTHCYDRCRDAFDYLWIYLVQAKTATISIGEKWHWLSVSGRGPLNL